MNDQKQWAGLLRNRNLKATSKRIEVLSVISQNEKAIPLSEIQKSLKDFDRVTLYRTIQALTENGIIHKAMSDEKNTYYAICSHRCSSHQHDHKHIHFKCNSCHTVSCVQAEQSISLSILGHSIEDFEIEAKGICASCSNS